MPRARLRLWPRYLLILLALLVGNLLLLAYLPRPGLANTAIFSWESLAPAPLTRFEAQGGAVAGKLYVFGGFYNTSVQATSRSDVYDPATNSWARIADMPAPLTHAATAIDGPYVYLVGGYRGDNPGPSVTDVWRYDVRTDSWAALPSLPQALGGGAAAVIDRRLYFAGGALRAGGTTEAFDKPDHYVLELDGGTAWAAAAPLPAPRNHVGGVALNGKFYLIGGQIGEREGDTNQRRVDVYDPQTDSWSQAAPLPDGRSHISASVLAVDDRIFVVGGTADGGQYGFAAADLFVYDSRVDTWVELPPLPGERKTPVAGVIGRRLYVATGSDGGPTDSAWAGTLPNHWESRAALPVALGEVAGGIIGGTLYVLGEGSPATLAYNLGSNTWRAPGAVAARPLVGSHHAAEVFGGKLYLFGGLGGGSEGKVQIYNPATNTWAAGADMPFAAGSSATGLINGKIYLAGGIVGDRTTAQAAVYDPVSDSWAALPPMPEGRNHAAAATDGSKLYVFGGRGPGSGDANVVADGFDTLQVYDPASGSWQSSAAPGAPLAPLPQARGGMGKAVYLSGEFYIIGGETVSGAGATADGVYSRVDVYDPAANRWRRASDMPTARHGIFPLAIAERIYIAAGGVRAATSQSTALEVYNVDWEVPLQVLPTAEPTVRNPSPSPTSGPGPTATPGPVRLDERFYLPVVRGR